jgi:hypothetical protein
MTILVDESNDNIPCPVCGQDHCVCEYDYEFDDDLYPDVDEEESEDENIP